MSVVEVVLTGLLYVFAVLALIVLLLVLMSSAVKLTEKLRRRSVMVKAVPEALTASGRQGLGQGRPDGIEGPEHGGSNAQTDPENDPGLVAAITAAIAAYEADNGTRFKLLSFRRADSRKGGNGR